MGSKDRETPPFLVYPSSRAGAKSFRTRRIAKRWLASLGIVGALLAAGAIRFPTWSGVNPSDYSSDDLATFADSPIVNDEARQAALPYLHEGAMNYIRSLQIAASSEDPETAKHAAILLRKIREALNGH